MSISAGKGAGGGGSVIQPERLVFFTQLLQCIVHISDHKAFRKFYPLCFSGSDAIDKVLSVPDFQCYSRDEAICLCQTLLRQRYFVKARPLSSFSLSEVSSAKEAQKEAFSEKELYQFTSAMYLTVIGESNNSFHNSMNGIHSPSTNLPGPMSQINYSALLSLTNNSDVRDRDDQFEPPTSLVSARGSSYHDQSRDGSLSRSQQSTSIIGRTDISQFENTFEESTQHNDRTGSLRRDDTPVPIYVGLQGALDKRRKKAFQMAMFQQRFFKLDIKARCLVYSSQIDSPFPLGYVLLNDITAIYQGDKKGRFDIHANGRVFALRADTDELRKKWISGLNAARHDLFHNQGWFKKRPELPTVPTPSPPLSTTFQFSRGLEYIDAIGLVEQQKRLQIEKDKIKNDENGSRADDTSDPRRRPSISVAGPPSISVSVNSSSVGGTSGGSLFKKSANYMSKVNQQQRRVDHEQKVQEKRQIREKTLLATPEDGVSSPEYNNSSGDKEPPQPLQPLQPLLEDSTISAVQSPECDNTNTSPTNNEGKLVPSILTLAPTTPSVDYSQFHTQAMTPLPFGRTNIKSQFILLPGIRNPAHKQLNLSILRVQFYQITFSLTPLDQHNYLSLLLERFATDDDIVRYLYDIIINPNESLEELPDLAYLRYSFLDKDRFNLIKTQFSQYQQQHGQLYATESEITRRGLVTEYFLHRPYQGRFESVYREKEVVVPFKINPRTGKMIIAPLKCVLPPPTHASSTDPSRRFLMSFASHVSRQPYLSRPNDPSPKDPEFLTTFCQPPTINPMSPTVANIPIVPPELGLLPYQLALPGFVYKDQFVARGIILEKIEHDKHILLKQQQLALTQMLYPILYTVRYHYSVPHLPVSYTKDTPKLKFPRIPYTGNSHEWRLPRAPRAPGDRRSATLLTNKYRDNPLFHSSKDSVVNRQNSCFCRPFRNNNDNNNNNKSEQSGDNDCTDEQTDCVNCLLTKKTDGGLYPYTTDPEHLSRIQTLKSDPKLLADAQAAHRQRVKDSGNEFFLQFISGNPTTHFKKFDFFAKDEVFDPEWDKRQTDGLVFKPTFPKRIVQRRDRIYHRRSGSDIVAETVDKFVDNSDNCLKSSSDFKFELIFPDSTPSYRASIPAPSRLTYNCGNLPHGASPHTFLRADPVDRVDYEDEYREQQQQQQQLAARGGVPRKLGLHRRSASDHGTSTLILSQPGVLTGGTAMPLGKRKKTYKSNFEGFSTAIYHIDNDGDDETSNKITGPVITNLTKSNVSFGLVKTYQAPNPNKFPELLTSQNKPKFNDFLESDLLFDLDANIGSFITPRTYRNLINQRYRILHESTLQLAQFRALPLRRRARIWLFSPSFPDVIYSNFPSLGTKYALPFIWLWFQALLHNTDQHQHNLLLDDRIDMIDRRYILPESQRKDPANPNPKNASIIPLLPGQTYPGGGGHPIQANNGQIYFMNAQGQIVDSHNQLVPPSTAAALLQYANANNMIQYDNVNSPTVNHIHSASLKAQLEEIEEVVDPVAQKRLELLGATTMVQLLRLIFATKHHDINERNDVPLSQHNTFPDSFVPSLLDQQRQKPSLVVPQTIPVQNQSITIGVILGYQLVDWIVANGYAVDTKTGCQLARVMAQHRVLTVYSPNLAQQGGLLSSYQQQAAQGHNTGFVESFPYDKTPWFIRNIEQLFSCLPLWQQYEVLVHHHTRLVQLINQYSGYYGAENSLPPALAAACSTKYQRKQMIEDQSQAYNLSRFGTAANNMLLIEKDTPYKYGLTSRSRELSTPQRSMKDPLQAILRREQNDKVLNSWLNRSSLTTLLAQLADDHWKHRWTATCRSCHKAAQNFLYLITYYAGEYCCAPPAKSLLHESLGDWVRIYNYIPFVTLRDQTIIHSLATLLSQPLDTITFQTQENGSDFFQFISRPVSNSALFRTFFLKLYGSDLTIRCKVLYNLLFMLTSHSSALYTLTGWTDWVLSLLDDVIPYVATLRARPWELYHDPQNRFTRFLGKQLPEAIIQAGEMYQYNIFQFVLGIMTRSLSDLLSSSHHQERLFPLFHQLVLPISNLESLHYGNDFNPHLNIANAAMFNHSFDYITAQATTANQLDAQQRAFITPKPIPGNENAQLQHFRSNTLDFYRQACVEAQEIGFGPLSNQWNQTQALLTYQYADTDGKSGSGGATSDHHHHHHQSPDGGASHDQDVAIRIAIGAASIQLQHTPAMETIPVTLFPWYENKFNLPLSTIGIASALRPYCYRSQLKDAILSSLSRSTPEDYLLPRQILHAQISTFITRSQDKKNHRIHQRLPHLLYLLLVIKSFIFGLAVRLDERDVGDTEAIQTVPQLSAFMNSVSSGNSIKHAACLEEHSKPGNVAGTTLSPAIASRDGLPPEFLAQFNTRDGSALLHKDNIYSLQNQLSIPACAFVLGRYESGIMTKEQFTNIPAMFEYYEGRGLIWENDAVLGIQSMFDSTSINAPKFDDVWNNVHWREPFGLDQDIELLERALALIIAHKFVDPEPNPSEQLLRGSLAAVNQASFDSKKIKTNDKSVEEDENEVRGLISHPTKQVWETFMQLEPDPVYPGEYELYAIREIQQLANFFKGSVAFLSLIREQLLYLTPKQIQLVIQKFVTGSSAKTIFSLKFEKFE